MARGFQSGNTFGTGQNQFSPRAKGGVLDRRGRPTGVLSVTVDYTRMGARARRVAGMAARADRPIMLAYTRLAEELQEYIAGELETSVRRKGGRAQRKKPADQRLANAIRSKKNRRVNVDGYSVGYLDTIAAVRPYWRGLEVGTRVHVGRVLTGSFQNPAGKLVRPVEGGKDPRFIQFSNTTVRRLQKTAANGAISGMKRSRAVNAHHLLQGVEIKNAIVGYHYIKEGLLAFEAAGWTRSMAADEFRWQLSEAGLGELASTLTRKDMAPSRTAKGIEGGEVGPSRPNPRNYTGRGE